MEKHSAIHPLGVMSAVGFLLNVVYQVEDVFFYFQCVQALIRNGWWVFSNAHSASLVMSHGFHILFCECGVIHELVLECYTKLAFPTWCIISLICCWIWFTNVLLMFISVFIKDIDLQFFCGLFLWFFSDFGVRFLNSLQSQIYILGGFHQHYMVGFFKKSFNTFALNVISNKFELILAVYFVFPLVQNFLTFSLLLFLAFCWINDYFSFHFSFYWF